MIWTKIQLTTQQCIDLQLLPDRDGYYYNRDAEKFGRIVRFHQNRILDSSVRVKYGWLK